ncbi:MAG: acetyl-CoA carboxylase biotin carboxyl carrier protein [Candidatus Limnocylindrales bacterium]
MTDDAVPVTADATAESAAEPAAPSPPRDAGDVALLGLIDRLASLLDRSDLTELEVGSGGTGILLRKPSATATALPAAPATVAAAESPSGAVASTAGDAAPAVPEKPSVKAPLTGIFYASPAPGSAPYVQVGGEVAVGQVIGLIEAMKLFNEIKSDLAGRVVRVVPDSGTLVKAKQPLLEVEPL